jgi:hypothetical protein
MILLISDVLRIPLPPTVHFEIILVEWAYWKRRGALT